MHVEARLNNVSIVERVADSELETFLSAANVWVIPYRENVAGVSVPSRFYNLLAVGRPIILVSEPEAEAALTVEENGIGWVVLPGRVDQLVTAILAALQLPDDLMRERAAIAARNFNISQALESYSQLMKGLIGSSQSI